HLEIISLLDVKDLIIVISKKDLISKEQLSELYDEIDTYLENFDFRYTKIAVSIYLPESIDKLKEALFQLDLKSKPEENFFRYYVDRVFSPKGIGTVVTGTVLGKSIETGDKVFICELEKETKVKNIQVHNETKPEAFVSNRAALNLSNVDYKKIKKGFLICQKGFLRGFDSVDIYFESLDLKKLIHNREYSVFIGSKKLNGKVLFYDVDCDGKNGLAKIKLEEKIFSIYGEKIIIREENQTIAGGIILNPINDPMKKSQKKEFLQYLEKKDLKKAFEVLINVHKKGFGLVSSYQRFGKNHEDVLEIANSLENVFIDEKELVVYPSETENIIKETIIEIFKKNSYALLSPTSLSLRIKWASENLIENTLEILVKEKILKKESGLYSNLEIKEDLLDVLKNRVLQRLKDEGFTPTAPYNIYDDMYIDRKTGDGILKDLSKSKNVVRLQHNIFIEGENLSKVVDIMRGIIDEHGFIDIKLLKESLSISRKYLIAYLDYLDQFSDIKKEDNKRVKA
ncbi:MAG: SelB C-terminal domain-containing protein, partial [Campylobacterales bacterium]|nr:SelB C-terminal domain-containing protein [Campylobacterales bacterium]